MELVVSSFLVAVAAAAGAFVALRFEEKMARKKKSEEAVAPVEVPPAHVEARVEVPVPVPVPVVPPPQVVPPAPVLDTQDEYTVHVEVVLVPTGAGDWAESIQRQINGIEGRDPTAQLVSSTTVNGRIVLFYRRRKQAAR